MIRVLFVCMGNICRSPLAQGAFEKRVADKGLSRHIMVDSAGTISYHNGKPPDKRSIAAASARDMDISGQRSRLLHPDDIEDFHYILVMDIDNYRRVHEIAGVTEGELPHVRLLLDYAPHMPLKEVPDPYSGHARDFDNVLRAVDDASIGLLNTIIDENNLGAE